MGKKIPWQLENSLAIIYWSITWICLFFGLIFILERATIHWKSFFFLIMCVLLVYLSRKRKLVFTESGVDVSFARFWKKQFIYYNEIQEIQVQSLNIRLIFQGKELDLRLKKKDFPVFLSVMNQKLSSTQITTKEYLH